MGLAFAIRISHFARQCRHAVVRQNVAIQGIQARIVEVRRSWRKQHNVGCSIFAMLFSDWKPRISALRRRSELNSSSGIHENDPA
jgi:hypothetical protein